jgi:hypothetical protein
MQAADRARRFAIGTWRPRLLHLLLEDPGVVDCRSTTLDWQQPAAMVGQKGGGGGQKRSKKLVVCNEARQVCTKVAHPM